jgi:hypothetical protein
MANNIAHSVSGTAEDAVQAWLEEVVRRASAKGKKGSFHLRQHQALAEMYAEAMLPIASDDAALVAPRKLVEGAALAIRLGRKKDGREPWGERRKTPDLFSARVSEALATPEALKSVLAERAVTRAYLEHLDDTAFAVAQACFFGAKEAEPAAGPELDTSVGETGAWPPERVVCHITDKNMHAEGVQERLAWVPGNKVLTISRRSIKELEIRQAVRFFEACGASREAALVNLGQVILIVDGYDGDRRELWQIPQARRFFARLWRAVPHLLFFLLPEGPPGQVGSVMFFITMLHPDPRGRGSSQTADGKWEMRIDREWIATQFLTEGFAAMNAFCARHGIDPSDAPVRSLVARIDKELRADCDGGVAYH